MTELMKLVSHIPDAYDDFVFGVINYAKEKPEHITILLDYLHSNPDATTSDVVYFMAIQDDFFENIPSESQNVS